MAPSPTTWAPTLPSPRPGWLAAASPPPAGGSIMPGPNRDFPGILPADRSSARGHKKGASAACIVANPHHSPTTPSLHVVAACRIASPNTDDRPRAWLASAHHDASPDTLSSQHEPCGGRGASPTRRRPTSIAALSTVTAARRQGGKQPPDVRLQGICALLHKHVLRCCDADEIAQAGKPPGTPSSSWC